MTESLTKTYSVFQKTFAGVRRRTALFYMYRWPKNTFEWPRVFLDVNSPHILGGISFQIHISMIGSAVCSMSQSVQNCQQRIFKNTGMSSLRQLNTFEEVCVYIQRSCLSYT